MKSTNAAVLMLVLALPSLQGCGDADAVAAEKESDAAVLPVQTQVVEALSGYLAREEYTGRVTSRRKSRLGFERGGRLVRLLVDEGDRVEEGQLLAELDLRELTARRQELIARVSEIEARLALAERTTERQRQLRESDFASQARLDEAVFGEQALEAQLAAARAGLESVDVALDLSRLEAPYAGSVTAREADEGTVVGPGEPLFELIEDGAMEARIGMPPETAAGLEPGGRFEVTIAGRVHDARHHATLSSVEPDTRTVTTIFRLPQSAGIPDGVLARISVERRVETPGFWLPITALAESRRGLWSAYVVTPDAEGIATVDRRELEILHAEADRAFVRGTLREGEHVVSSGVHRLVPGQHVRVMAAPAVALR